MYTYTCICLYMYIFSPPVRGKVRIPIEHILHFNSHSAIEFTHTRAPPVCRKVDIFIEHIAPCNTHSTQNTFYIAIDILL